MNNPPCPACGLPAPLVHVHGHAQCSHCGTVIESCCMGAGDEESDACGAEINLDPVHLQRVFAPAGTHNTLTQSAAAHRLHEVLGCNLTTALGALDGAVAAGALERTAAGHLRLPQRS